MDIRLGALKLYRQHLVAQYADRCAYWALKDISSDVMAQTITITTDGADQVPWFFFSVGKGGKQFKLQYVFFLSCPWASCMRQSTKYLGTQTCELLIGAVSFNEDPCCMGFRPCSSCGHFGRAHFSRKQYGEGIALPCFGGCDGWMWEGWSPTTTHLCGSGWQYSKRVEKLDKSHLCSTAGAKPLSEVTWFANARFLHFTRVYFFLMGWLFWFS